MTEQNGSGVSAREQGWGIAIGITVLTGFVAVGAASSGVPGDRPGGIVLSAVFLLAMAGLMFARRRPHTAAAVAASLAGVQLLAGAGMVAARVGALPVVVAINGILFAGWLLVATLFKGPRAAA